MRTHKNLYVVKYIVGMMLTSTLLLSSCNEDTIFEENKIETTGEGINFGLSKLDNSWEPDTRSTKSGNRFVMRSENSSDTLCVSTSVLDGISTASGVESRGVRENTLNGNSFQVKAYYYDEDASTPSSVLFDQSYNVADNGTISLGNDAHTYYWPQTGGFTFLATANAEGLTITDTDQKNGNYVATPSLSYTIASDVTDQKDAMVAFTGNTLINNNDNGAAVPLTFTHLCAAVQFQLDSEVDNAISSIEISNVYGGTINYIYNDTNDTWEPNYDDDDDATTDYTTALSTESSSEEETTLLLAPQTLTANARITVNFSDGRESVTTEAGALEDNVWEMGMTYIYKLSITPEYTLEFTEYEEVLDAHYIITKIKFKTDVNWTMSVPDEAAGWAYLSKEKSNTQKETKNKDYEITSAQKTGMWTYVERCNKQTISGNVTEEGKEEEVTVYMLLRENASEVSRNVNLQLAKTGETTSKEKQFTQLGYKIYPEKTVTNADGTTTTYPAFAMERIEDSTSPYGFAVNYTNVKYTFKGAGNITTNFWGYLWSWIVSAITNGLKYWSLTPNDMIINITTDVSTTASPTNGLANTTSSSNLTVDVDQGYLIEQGWYTTTTNINLKDIKAAVQSVLSKNNYGEFTGTNDDSGELTLTGTNATGTIKWYLPAINEMLRINSQDSGTGVSPYTSGNITDDTPTCYWTSTALTDYKATDDDTNLYAYSWCFGATAGTQTTRGTTLKVRAARIIE